MRYSIIAAAISLLICTGCRSVSSSSTMATPVAAAPVMNWSDGVAGFYSGKVGGNGDPITIILTNFNGTLGGTYMIDDPAFSAKPYKGTLTDFKAVAGKPMTLSCRYTDEMNSGTYELTFSPDLKSLSGTYEIENEGASDENTVSARRN